MRDLEYQLGARQVWDVLGQALHVNPTWKSLKKIVIVIGGVYGFAMLGGVVLAVMMWIESEDVVEQMVAMALLQGVATYVVVFVGLYGLIMGVSFAVQYHQMKKMGLLEKSVVRLGDEGLEISRNQTLETQWDYAAITAIENYKSLLMLWLDGQDKRNAYLIIPQKAFADKEEKQEFLRILDEKQNKAESVETSALSATVPRMRFRTFFR